MTKCIITGNGPSLNEIPRGVLDQYPTFGVNYCNYQPDFFLCVDHDLLINHNQEIYNHAKGAVACYLAGKEQGTSDLYKLPNVNLVWKDESKFKREIYFSGLTVVYVALKVAYYMGFEEVHLWGVDHSADWAHYKDEYPRGDVAGRAARMAGMEYHYRLAAEVYSQERRRIINHSRPSKLDAIFERGK